MSRFNADFFDKNLNNVHHDTIERPEIDDDYLNPDTSEIYISRTDKVVRLYKIHWSSQEQRKVNTIEEVGGIQNGYLLFFLAKNAGDDGGVSFVYTEGREVMEEYTYGSCPKLHQANA